MIYYHLDFTWIPYIRVMFKRVLGFGQLLNLISVVKSAWQEMGIWIHFFQMIFLKNYEIHKYHPDNKPSNLKSKEQLRITLTITSFRSIKGSDQLLEIVGAMPVPFVSYYVKLYRSGVYMR